MSLLLLSPCSRVAGYLACQGKGNVAGHLRYFRGGRGSSVQGTNFNRLSGSRVPPVTYQKLPSVAVCAAGGNGAAAVQGGDGGYDFDLFTIGAGSGGVRASRVAAGTYGARVAVCELPFNTIASDTAGGAGGTCVLRGCVPKKLFVYASEFAEDFKDAQGFGWDIPGTPTIDWQTFLAKKNAELRRLNGIYTKMLENSGVTMIEGRGRIVDPHTVEVDGVRYTAKHILIATGGRAFVPPFEGAELAMISDQILELPAVPKSLAVVGGGYIAVEFAGVFARLGSEVHVVFRQERPLKGFDEEVRAFITGQYEANGYRLHPCCNPTSISKTDDGRYSLTFTHKDSGEADSVTVDAVLMATGRKPNTRGLGLEQVGVKLDKSGAVAVDAFSRSSVSSIWAVGDVTNRKNLTPVALMEGSAFCKTAFGGEPTAPDFDNVASAVFSWPQLATVGMTEEEAVAAVGDVDVFTSTFRPMKNTISGNPDKTFMKVVVDGSSDRVLGCHMVGPEAAEIMQGLAIGVKFGVKKAELDSVVGIHPSAAEEFVTMRTPTRKVRNKVAAQASVAAA